MSADALQRTGVCHHLRSRCPAGGHRVPVAPQAVAIACAGSFPHRQRVAGGCHAHDGFTVHAAHQFVVFQELRRAPAASRCVATGVDAEAGCRADLRPNSHRIASSVNVNGAVPHHACTVLDPNLGSPTIHRVERPCVQVLGAAGLRPQQHAEATVAVDGELQPGDIARVRFQPLGRGPGATATGAAGPHVVFGGARLKAQPYRSGTLVVVDDHHRRRRSSASQSHQFPPPCDGCTRAERSAHAPRRAHGDAAGGGSTAGAAPAVKHLASASGGGERDHRVCVVARATGAAAVDAGRCRGDAAVAGGRYGQRESC